MVENNFLLNILQICTLKIQLIVNYLLFGIKYGR